METPCPHCGAALTPPVKVCPYCGVILADTWPPAPSNFDTPLAPIAPKLVTGKVWGDITLGVFLSFAANFIYCLGFIVMPILYLTLQPKYPIFARGIGYGTLAGLALLLGAFAWCLSSGFAGWHP